MTDMKVRHPDFNLDGLTPHWAPNHEFADLDRRRRSQPLPLAA